MSIDLAQGPTPIAKKNNFADFRYRFLVHFAFSPVIVRHSNIIKCGRKSETTNKNTSVPNHLLSEGYIFFIEKFTASFASMHIFSCNFLFYCSNSRDSPDIFIAFFSFPTSGLRTTADDILCTCVYIKIFTDQPQYNSQCARKKNSYSRTIFC